MQKKLAILALVVLCLVCIFTACDTEKVVTDLEIVGVEEQYKVNTTLDYDSISVKITFDDGSSVTKTINQAKSEYGADVVDPVMVQVGTAMLKVTIGEVSKSVTFEVVEIVIEAIDGFELPLFVQEYNDRSQDTTGEMSFKKQGEVYEVGNANGFVFDPLVSIWMADGQDTLPASQIGAQTTLSLFIGDSATTATTAVAESEIPGYVTVEGANYFFTKKAAEVGYIKMQVSLTDEKLVDLVDSGTQTTLSLVVKVIDGGYNVFEQHGLSVMTDLISPTFWADIWGVDIGTDGSMVARTDSLTLPNDKQPLFKYVGNVDWLILHGDITLDADKMPADYFWSKNGESGNVYTWDGTKLVASAQSTAYETAIQSMGNSAIFTTSEAKKSALNGSLIEGTGYNDQGSAFDFYKDYYGNANKSLYATNKVNISGNYGSINIPSQPSASGRKFQTTVSADSAIRVDNPYCQWHVFGMLDEHDNFSSELHRDFVIKNLAFVGNSGRSESQGPKGLAMVHMGSKSLTTENIVAQKFYTNYTPDNFGIPGIINIVDSIVTDTYNTMAIAWRSKISIQNSNLTYAGGPLFVMSDGNRSGDGAGGWDYTTNTEAPELIVDDASVLESYSTGNETWYTQLGDAPTGVPYSAALFLQLQQINNSLTSLSGKTFVEKRTVSGVETSYMNVVAVYIVEGGQIFDLDSSVNYVPAGKFTSESFTFDMRGDTVAQGVRQIATTVLMKSGLSIEDTIASLTGGGQNYSGLNYAYVADDSQTPALGNPFAGNAQLEAMVEQQVRPAVLAQQALIEAGVKQYIMQQQSMTEEQFTAWVATPAGQATFTSAVNAEIEKQVETNVDEQVTKIWKDAWKGQSTSYIGMWLPIAAITSSPTSPYVGLILGSFTSSPAGANA